MATTHISNSNNSTLDTMITGTLFNSLGTATWAGPGGTIDNTGTDGSVVSYIAGDVILNFGTALVTGSGTPNLLLHVNPKTDGTNFGPTAASSQANQQYTIPLPASTTLATTVDLVLEGIPLGSYIYEFELQNNTGATFPASGTTLKMQRRTIANW